MKTLLHLLPIVALAASAQAAVITNSFVQNKAVNWTQVPGSTATQSTTDFGGVAERAIDGNTNGIYGGGSVTHTNPADPSPSWQVDLGAFRPITDITLFNRTDACCAARLANFSVLASNDPNFATTVWTSGNQGAVGASINFPGIAASAQYIRVQRDGPSGAGNDALSLAEVEVNGDALFSYTNLALGSSASQSSTLNNPAIPSAAKAIDGNLANAFGAGTTTHTNPGQTGDIFWETTLSSLSSINEIALYNRGDCCQDRLSNFRVSIFDGTNEVWGEDYFVGSGQAGNIFAIQEDAGGFIANGDRVRVQLINGTNNAGSGTDVLSLREVEIYGVAIPEPASASLFGLGALALLLRRRRS